MEVEAGSGLPEELDWLAPGPELARLLDSVERSGLDGGQLLRVAAARQRLIAHQEAQLLADLHAVARAVPDQGPQPGRRDQPGKYPWAECEAAFALRWTYQRAAAQMLLADEVIDRVPAVFAALDTGRIDVPRARVIAEAVACLEEPAAAAVVDKVIDQAPQQTTGTLRARLQRLVAAADAQAVANRARRDSAERRRVVAAVNDHNHLAMLAGYDLAPHTVAAVMERLDAIARAAKAAGDPRRADQLRADAFLDLLAGQGIATGAPTTDHSITRLDTGPGTGPDTGPGTSLEAGPDAGLEGETGTCEAGHQPPPPRPAAPPAGEADHDLPWPTAPADPTLLTDPPPPQPQPQPVPVDPHDAGDLWAAGVPEPPEQTTLAQTAAPAGALPAPRRGVVELQVPLTTLLGLSDLPGELEGWGPVVADLARQTTRQMHHATWRYSIYDTLGELAYHGTTTARPHPRRPTTQVAAHVKARDRRCVAPGCRRTARTTDLDHTIDWAHGGPTEPANLGLLCRMHHRLKGTTGCHLIQLSSGVFAWSTPHRRQYRTTPDRPLIDDNDLTGIPKPDD